jgi:hypothetical protein
MAGLLTDDEAAVLQTRLKANTDLRRLYLHYMNLDVALEAQAGSRDRVIDLLRAAPLTENKPAGRWSSWRPLTAAAAGIVFGILCTSMVFGLGSLAHLPQVKRLFPLKNGDFEEAVGTLSANPPADFGLWTGVRAEVVDGTSEAGPKSGKRMLRFMRGDANASKPGAPPDRCDVYQLIDLRPIWKQVGPEDEVTLALSASFLDAQAASGEKTAFRCRILVNPGPPELVREGWPDSRMGGCAYARADLETSPSTRGQWQTAQAKVFLPRNAQVVAVQLSVSLAAESPASDDVFRQCYADDVTLTVSSHAPNPKK